MLSHTVTIVLAEDDDGHATLVERNLKRAGFANTLVRVRDGQEVLDLLDGVGAFSARQPSGPVLLVLDIKMPRLDGIGLLERLKAEPRFSKIPVIMLTTTDDPRDIERCYALGCNIFITKPVAYEAFVEAIRRLGLFLEVVRFPGND